MGLQQPDMGHMKSDKAAPVQGMVHTAAIPAGYVLVILSKRCHMWEIPVVVAHCSLRFKVQLASRSKIVDW